MLLDQSKNNNFLPYITINSNIPATIIEMKKPFFFLLSFFHSHMHAKSYINKITKTSKNLTNFLGSFLIFLEKKMLYIFNISQLYE